MKLLKIRHVKNDNRLENKMKKIILIWFMTITSLLSFSNSKEAELKLEQFIDSIFKSNDIDYEACKSEFFEYSKKNYRKVKTIKDFAHFSANKLKSKLKEFTKNSTKELKSLHYFSIVSFKAMDEIENKCLKLIQEHNFWDDKNLINSIYLNFHSYNYWELNSYKPQDIGCKTNKLYTLSENTNLIDKIVLIVFATKIYKASYYVNPKYICESNCAKVKIVEDLDTTNIKTTLLVLEKPSNIKLLGRGHFIGGTAELNKFIKNNIMYPRKAKELDQHGIVYVSFAIDNKGQVKDVKIKKSPSEFLSKEVVRMVYSFPNWKPTISNNKSVESKFTLPVKFEIDN